MKLSPVAAEKPWRWPPSPRAAAEAIQTLGALASAGVVIWQRLTLERVLDVPPPTLALVAWISIVAFVVTHLLAKVPARSMAASVVLFAAVHYAWTLGPPKFAFAPDLEEYRFRMAGYLSSTWHGLPLTALLAATATLGWAWLCTQSLRWRTLAVGVGTIVLLFGATTVLGYATGSPWPLGV